MQFADWEEAARLGDEAQANGFTPTNSYEWLPLIQGYAMSKRWEDALDRSQRAYAEDETIAASLCHIWEEASAQSIPPNEWGQAIQELKNRLQCVNSQSNDPRW